MAKHAQILNGYLAAASITAAYATVKTTLQDLDVLLVANSTNQPLLFKIPDGSGKEGWLANDPILIPSGISFALDCWSNGKRIPAGIFQVKALSSVPTTGHFSIVGML